MILIASVLLNAPALAGALGAEGGPGGPPAGDPSRGGGADGGAAAARFDGSLSAVINFPFSGGTDQSLSVALPGECLVLNATLQLDGSSTLPPAKDRKCTFADTENNRAYDGVSEDSPPTGNPGTFQSSQLSGGSCSAISREDGNLYETMTWGFGSPYHLFKFKVTEDVVQSLSIRYVGAGYDWLLMSTDLQLYIYNSGHWSNIGGNSGMGPDSSLVTIKKTIQSPAGCIDSNGWVNILAMGPDGWIFSFLDTDYIELSVKGADYSWPSNLSLDLGADGFVELEHPGELRGSALIGSELLREPLQAFVDDLGEEGGGVEVPFRFGSATGGVLAVKGQIEIDLPPVFSPIPPERLVFEEDTPAFALVDLDSYCRDDRDARPRYEIFLKPNDGKIECTLNASGHHLDFRPLAANWHGTREFGLRATDSSGLSADTFFNVTVTPVNDPPVLYPVPDQTAWEDEPFTLVVRAYDFDDPPANLTFTDDFVLSDISGSTGVFAFTPTNEQVGRYPVNVTVTDASGAAATIFFWLTVENVNDPPVLFADEELYAVEDERFEYEPYAEDIDRGDDLTFSLESDISGLQADPETGLIEFVFQNEHVGDHELVLTVTDLSGASDSLDILLTVENVNDPPVLEQGVQLVAVEDEEFEYRINASDVDAGDSLEYSVDAGFLELDERTGVISFTPGDEHVGRHKLAVTVTDRSGATATARYILVVENVNDAPSRLEILAPRTGAEVREGKPVEFSASAFDPDIGDVLTYTWKERDVVIGRGQNLSAGFRPGRHLVTLEVSDGKANATAEVGFTVLPAQSSGWGFTGALLSWAFPLGLVVAAAIVVAVVVTGRGGRSNGGAARPRPPPGPPFQPGPMPPFLPPNQPPAPQGQPAVAGQPVGYPQWPPVNAPAPPQAPAGSWQGMPGAPPAWQAPAPGGWQSAAPGPHQAPPLPAYAADPRHAPPENSPPYMDRTHLPPPFTRVPENQPEAPPRPTATGIPAGTARRSAPPGGRPAAAPPEAGPPCAIPLGEGAPAPETTPDRPAGPPASGAPAAPDERQGPEPDDRAGSPPPRQRNRSRRRGDEGTVSRSAMRSAINDARHAISAARAAGLNPADCDRLLSESMAASYRLDYVRARNLARRAESVALSMLERTAREEEEGGPVYGEDAGLPGEEADEAA
jgi:hypothetical protein